MQDQKSQLALDLWSKLTKAHDTVRKSHVKQMSQHKLTAPQFHVLEVLKAAGPMPLKRISEELMVTGANITCVVDNLEKEDLVKRVPSKEDRRIINAELTDKGREKMTVIFPQYVTNMMETASTLSEDEQRELSRLLTKLH
ncbi:MAG: MarR family transcriptional regulator [Bacteroidetes bacterium]|nr:MarR family transcriptional regulator [Bacteroidota bacterium]